MLTYMPLGRCRPWPLRPKPCPCTVGGMVARSAERATIPPTALSCAPWRNAWSSCRLQQFRVLRAGEMATLVAVENLRRRRGQRRLHRPRHERLGQTLVEFPTDHISAEPVEHRDQIQPAAGQADIGDVDAPDLIG